MNKFLSTLGILMTALYIVGVAFIRPDAISSFGELELNEFGDYLAGVFGPVALLWLILGFFQQGIELRQNRDALLAQAKELKDASEQAKALAENSEKQLKLLLEEKQLKREPDLRAEVGDVQITGETHVFVVTVRNYGETAFNLEASFRPNDEAKNGLQKSNDGKSYWQNVDLSGGEFSTSKMGKSFLKKGEVHQIEAVFGGRPFRRFSVKVEFITIDGESRSKRFGFKSLDGLRYGLSFEG